jgi:2-dehydropantoate 2-reductase
VRFSIVGAGAIGAFVGARLARAGFEVTLIARGAHLAAMRANGVRVREPDGSEFAARPRCTDDLSAIGGSDCVFVTLKAHGLPEMATRLAGATPPHACLVFAQNGIPWWYTVGSQDRLESVDPGGVIASHIDLGRVIGCIAYPAASLPEPGVVLHEEGERISLGELDGSRTERVREIAAALTRAGFKAPISSRLRPEIWVKLLGNATLNPVSALARATVGEILGDPQASQLVRALMLEVAEVARASGVELPVGVDRRLAGAAGAGDHKTSMLQDVEAGRPLEVGALVGSVVELGDRLGVPVPRLGAVHACLELLDRSLRRASTMTTMTRPK